MGQITSSFVKYWTIVLDDNNDLLPCPVYSDQYEERYGETHKCFFFKERGIDKLKHPVLLVEDHWYRTYNGRGYIKFQIPIEDYIVKARSKIEVEDAIRSIRIKLHNDSMCNGQN